MTHAAPDRSVATVVRPDGPAAARAVDLRKVYGSGDTQVAALDGVSVEFGPASSPPSWARPGPASRR